jgi:hypothetical protein
MSKWIKLDPIKPFKIPEGYRVGRVSINGKIVERSSEAFKKTSIDDDKRFIEKLQIRILQRSIEWVRKKIR